MKLMLLLMSLTACATLPRGNADPPRNITIYEGDSLTVDGAPRTFPAPGKLKLANGSVVNVLPVMEPEAAQ